MPKGSRSLDRGSSHLLLTDNSAFHSVKTPEHYKISNGLESLSGDGKGKKKYWIEKSDYG